MTPVDHFRARHESDAGKPSKTISVLRVFKFTPYWWWLDSCLAGKTGARHQSDDP